MLNNLSYNANLNKYFSGETEITQEEFEYATSRLRLAENLVLRIRAGEIVEVPEDIGAFVEEQLEYLAEQDRERELNVPEEEIAESLEGIL